MIPDDDLTRILLDIESAGYPFTAVLLRNHIATLEAERDRYRNAMQTMALLARPCETPAVRLQTIHDYATEALGSDGDAQEGSEG